MIGAIIGDIVGSIYEFANIRTKDFELFSDRCDFTDDSILTLAIANAILKTKELPTSGSSASKDEFTANCRDEIVRLAKQYPNPMGSYGGRFSQWIYSHSHEPYGSFGNGSAMRVASCGFAASSLAQAAYLAECSASVTHNHPEGIKGACATAECIYLARTGHSKEEIRSHVEKNYYQLNMTVEGLRKSYFFNETCQNSVPQAIVCFLESNSFEDAIRNAISIGGDSDTLGAIVGGIAEAYYGVPDWIREKAEGYLTPDLSDILRRFEEKYN